MNNTQPKIGVDRLKLYNLHVARVDEKKLLERKRKCTGGNEIEVTNKDKGNRMITGCKIIDNIRFADLVWGTNKLAGYGGHSEYCMLTLTVHHICGSNIDNLSIEDYKAEMVNLRDYIYKEYGVLLEFINAKVKQIEVNCSIELLNVFSDYGRVVALFFNGMPGRWNKLSDEVQAELAINENGATVHQNTPETFSRKNTRMEVVIYDKAREVEKNDHVKPVGNLMRIELRLLNEKKISDVFETNNLADISDDMLANYYCDSLMTLFWKPFEKWRVKNHTYLQGLIKEYQQPHKPWQLRLLYHLLDEEVKTHMPQLLDIRDLVDAMPQDIYNHKARSVKAFDKFESISDVFFRKDRDKVYEIIGAIEKAYLSSIVKPDDGVTEFQESA